MTKAASVHRLSERIAAREQSNFRAKIAKHDCVLERRAISDDVLITFQNSAEQHRLHIAFGEDWCGACSVCEKMRAEGREPTKLNTVEIAGMRRHWYCLVTFAKLYALEHIKLGCEVLAPYRCQRGIDGKGDLHMKTEKAVSAEDAVKLAALGWRAGEDGVWSAGARK